MERKKYGQKHMEKQNKIKSYKLKLKRNNSKGDVQIQDVLTEINNQILSSQFLII